MNLVQIGRTLSSLMSQVQEFIHDYNVTRAVNDNSASSSNRFSFPGLKTRTSSSSIQQPTPATLMEEKGMDEILLLQQRTVLQVG